MKYSTIDYLIVSFMEGRFRKKRLKKKIRSEITAGRTKTKLQFELEKNVVAQFSKIYPNRCKGYKKEFRKLELIYS